MTYPRLLRWLPLAAAVWLVMPQGWSQDVKSQAQPSAPVQIDISTLTLER